MIFMDKKHHQKRATCHHQVPLTLCPHNPNLGIYVLSLRVFPNYIINIIYIYIYIYIYPNPSHESTWSAEAVEYANCISAEGSPQYDTEQSDNEAQVMLEL